MRCYTDLKHKTNLSCKRPPEVHICINELLLPLVTIFTTHIVYAHESNLYQVPFCENVVDKKERKKFLPKRIDNRLVTDNLS